jgi:hypothetical protein
MFAQGDRELSRYAAGYPVGLGSPELNALTSALTALAAISDEVTLAVQHHDRPALEQLNARAEEFVAQVNSLAAALTDEDRALIGATGIAILCERLAVGARRNAYLIEQAWAVDAALMRMLVGIGKVGPDGVGYGTVPTQAFVDRQA